MIKVRAKTTGIYCQKDGETIELPKDVDFEVDDKLKSYFDKHPRVLVLTETEDSDKGDKKPSAKDIVKLISEAESLEEIEQYKEDERQSVSKAYAEKVAELTPDSE